MRGDDEHQDAMFSYLSPEARVPHDHPLRIIRRLVDTILVELSPQSCGDTRMKGFERERERFAKALPTSLGRRDWLLILSSEAIGEIMAACKSDFSSAC